ncbi:MAG: hypothetical protein CMM42_12845 [Rhodospirillaceae bacterium]|nr:hypothetical protein [Rhodospirillaceae bacterium]|tara:strand:+ start:499 stop:714 length:216 start_codon:yes stop_codon:yes gene_type:complete
MARRDFIEAAIEWLSNSDAGNPDDELLFVAEAIKAEIIARRQRMQEPKGSKERQGDQAAQPLNDGGDNGES